ncbi:MAG: magnesium transporter [Alphaproteobacteria bacterium]
MSEERPRETRIAATPAAAGELLYRVDPLLVSRVDDALEAGRMDDLGALVAPLHAAELADLFEELSSERRVQLLEFLRGSLEAQVLTHLDETVRDEVLEHLDSAEVATAIGELAPDDAVEVIEDLEEDERREVLEKLSPSDRALLEQALAWPEDSAGRLMQRELVTVPPDWTVGDTIDYMRARAAHLPRDFYDIFAVDMEGRPVGVVPLSRLARNRRPVRIRDIMHPDLKPVPLDMDQEDVAFLFHQYGLISAPVIDKQGRLVGVITADDIVQVIQDEAEEDLLAMGGLREDDFYSAVVDATRTRFSWLLANLGTAIVASIVIGFFDAAIEKAVALAILMPIVASMGGNAGTQTLTVAVRALATKELTAANALRIVGKETLIGGINGIVFAILVGFVAWGWFGDLGIGAIIGLAMIINLVVAGFAGVIIPLVLDRLRVDPAVGSTVVLTTVTDVVGFLSFLGLAALVLL